VPTAQAGESREDWQQPDRVMADLGLKPGERVADVGCGGGYFTFRLAKAVGPTGKVFAADINPQLLNGLRDRVAREHLTNIEVVLSEPTDTKLQPESCDTVLLCDVVHEVTPPTIRAPLLQSIARAIKPGGFLFLIDYRKIREVKFDAYEKLIAREDLVKLGTDAGLILDAELHYLKYQVGLRFRKPPRGPGQEQPKKAK
jgi:ubiquinone/menaquinone biosynthesis C-methylase UbiE